ncbi:amidase signature domain-containing protein [Lasiosphaeria hispida]|uniref:amidase n=1 Tax=Lasiosphaeria hispida TaxID=260671 RepID=A0AAJ0MFJ2_9PEZI|nr:amidase signature domain-containing protein [Lasiosphaeria hispida]
MPPKKRSRSTKSWQAIAADAQRHRDESLSWVGNETEALPGIARDRDLRIANLDLPSLAQSMADGTYSAVDVLTAFSRMAVVAQNKVNCLTELLGARSLSRAEELDAYQTQKGKTMGLLHGVPISIKSHIGIQGSRMPTAYVSSWDSGQTAPRDALVVQILERAGAVIHARTTEPQSMMQLECSSNLYGVTLNPFNTDLSSGGSSGGEGALIAMRGSAIGVGSDVGGSIRVPAAACGIYGLKPTSFRLPTTGWSSTPPGADPIPTVLGPMSLSLEGIATFMDVVLAAEPWTVEPALVPMPWRPFHLAPTESRPLRIGIAWHDDVVLPHPPIVRALRELSEKIAHLPNVEVVEFPLYKLAEAWAIASSLYFTDGGEADLKIMADSGEPLLPLVEWIIHENPGTQKLSREELEYWLEEREEYRLEYAEHWNRTGKWSEAEGKWVDTVDVLICPVAPGVATRHNTAKYWPYSAVWNLVDYPALAFPVGKTDKVKDRKEKRDKFMSFQDSENWDLYDQEVFHNMPVGLQIVGRRFDDEKIVAVLRYLQSLGCL